MRYYGPGDIRLDNIPEPVVGLGQVKIKVSCTTICGSDLHLYHEKVLDTALNATESQPPVVMGHEFSGTIVELGPAVNASRLSVGQDVTVEPTITCMQPTCLDCSSPKTRNWCSQIKFIGVSGGGGGLSEYIVVDQMLVHPLPPAVSREHLEVGAMMEPLAVAWHAVKKANVSAGCSALILGAGPVGILLLKVLRAFGAGWVGVSGRSAKRCAFAQEHGASAVFDVASIGVDVLSETLLATHQRGVDVVFDCAGSQATMDTAIGAIRRGGIIVNLALWSTKPTIDMNILLIKEVVIANSMCYADDHPEMLEALAQGRFPDLQTLITRRIDFEDLVELGIMALVHEKHDHVKILVHP
ncbi:alcohol dehydrogenase GroES domain protein [Dichomitus squalens]|nr:alcohol dehydrogenase GroES domain protein [Dichomitus squalens]